MLIVPGRVGSVGGAARRKGGGVPAWAPEDAVFAADFLGQRYWRTARPDCVRASTAMALDSAGVWQTFGANELRLTDLGLMVPEPARTNLATGANMTGAVVGVIGSGGALPANWDTNNVLNCEVVSLTQEVNLDVIRIRRWRTGGAPLSTNTNVRIPGYSFRADVAAPTVMASAFVRLISSTGAVGSTDITIQETDRAAVGSTFHGQNSAAIADDGLLKRRVVSRSLAGDNSVIMAISHGLSSSTGDFEIIYDLALPQLENAASMSSPILTGGAGATRAADTVTLTAPAGTYDLHLLLDDASEAVITGWTPATPLPLDLAQGKFIEKAWGVAA